MCRKRSSCLSVIQLKRPQSDMSRRRRRRRGIIILICRIKCQMSHVERLRWSQTGEEKKRHASDLCPSPDQNHSRANKNAQRLSSLFFFKKKKMKLLCEQLFRNATFIHKDVRFRQSQPHDDKITQGFFKICNIYINKAINKDTGISGVLRLASIRPAKLKNQHREGRKTS